MVNGGKRKGFDFAQPDKKEQNLKLETFHIAIVTLNEVKVQRASTPLSLTKKSTT